MMRNRRVIVGLMCVLGSYYFASKVRTAKTRNTKIIDEIASNALSIAASLAKG